LHSGQNSIGGFMWTVLGGRAGASTGESADMSDGEMGGCSGPPQRSVPDWEGDD
jgi:hypothetical protein